MKLLLALGYRTQLYRRHGGDTGPDTMSSLVYHKAVAININTHEGIIIAYYAINLFEDLFGPATESTQPITA